VGRTEYLRRLGIEYRDLEKEGVYLVVADCHCRYRRPLKYDDLIRITTRLNRIGHSSMQFTYQIFLGQRLAAEGSSHHVFINKHRKPVKIPAPLLEVLKVLK
jgi:acyl-CoA thioester hydrolase